MWKLHKLFAVAACVAVGSAAGNAGAAELNVAFFASSSENGFNQAVYEGIEEKAAELGVSTEIYNGEFSPEIQYNQIEDILASGKFDGFIVLPSDTVGIAGAFEQVIAAGIPIATTLFPVGPDLNDLQPQVPGITTTVANLPVPGATIQANALVEHCADIDPCKVVVLIGAKIFPFDNLRLETILGIFAEHENIDVVATGEGWYDPDTSLTTMTDILQANSDIDAVVSNADQHLLGVEIALEAAGYNVADLYLSGGGAAGIAVDAIREGRWDATLAYFPKSMGSIALELIVAAINGETVPAAIDMDEMGPVPPLVTKAVLDAHPEFGGEWAQ